MNKSVCILSVHQSPAQLINYKSKDSLNGKPRISSFLIGRLKLNGIYDISGILHDKANFVLPVPLKRLLIFSNIFYVIKRF
ncbi:hypothetical protein [Pedobacter nyackensis]|uniref:Uncharacterized protein n=1 Tax=Pedobacter nyackensis TaxID=475255 RepID=A0A1W2E0I3_9SPHI|nr:hypothetical protein [Pedobacter nyackensis]SMD03243.1 hypothetical protein SAMN04488101_10958 [Pedobacter nyackensis]